MSAGIRYATRDDVERMASLWRATALHAYAGIFPPDCPKPAQADLAGNIRRDLGDPRGRGLVVERDNALVGMVMVRPWPDQPATGQFARLYVDVVCWREGIGTLLHDAALEEIRRLGFGDAKLWVLRDNARARAFYERRGWTLTGATTTNPPSGVEDVQYRRTL